MISLQKLFFRNVAIVSFCAMIIPCVALLYSAYNSQFFQTIPTMEEIGQLYVDTSLKENIDQKIFFSFIRHQVFYCFMGMVAMALIIFAAIRHSVKQVGSNLQMLLDLLQAPASTSFFLNPELNKIVEVHNIVTALEAAIQRDYKLKENFEILEDRYHKSQAMGKVGNWEYDPRTELFWISREVRRILGFDVNRAYIKKNEMAMSIPRKDKRFHWNALNKLIEKGESYHLEFEFISKASGEKKIILSHGEWTKNDKNASVKIIGVAKDITEFKLIEDNLRASRERFRLALCATRDGHTDYNIVADELYFSQRMQKIMGYEMGELNPNISFWEKNIHPKDYSLVQERFYAFYWGRDTHFEVEYRIKKKNGAYIWVLARGTCLCNEKGVPYRISCVHTDISHRKKIEKELVQARKMEAVGTLSGGVAHEFNNILAIILGCAELALDDTGCSEHTRHDLFKEIKLASLRGKDIVSQLMKFSRNDGQEKKVMAISTVTSDAVALLRATIPSMITLQENIASDCYPVVGNTTQLHQIIINLANNAVHAMEPHGGYLIIQLKNVWVNDTLRSLDQAIAPGKYVCLTISDTGYGIGNVTMDKVFDPFFTTKKVGKGSGMGLAVVHGIMKSHGGLITIHSEVDSGTQCDCYFPSEKGIVVKEEKKIIFFTQRNETILLVDDEIPLLNLSQKILQRLGYHVIARSCPLESLEYFRINHEQINLVITDFAMPGLTGDLFVQKMKEIMPDVRVIICSGYSSQFNHADLSQMGASAYLQKPFEIAELSKMLCRVLGKVGE